MPISFREGASTVTIDFDPLVRAPMPVPDREGRLGAYPRKAAWYRSRLAAMSAAEIGYRIGEQIKRAVSRVHRPDFAARAGSGALPILPLTGLALATTPPLLLERWRAVAGQAQTGRFQRLGVTWRGGARAARWHLDPITNERWPADRYCFDIAYRHNPEHGDIKHTWEINRLQHLPPMAALAAATGDQALAAACSAEIAGWIESNPPFQGINWISGIELALRAISLITAVSLLPQAAVPPVLRQRLRETFAAHGYWLRRYPSRHSSANNHLIAEATGLYAIGRLVPGLRDGADWAGHGRRVLIEECLKQIHDDGVGAEQSPSYTAFTLELLMLAGVIGDRRGEPFPEAFWQRIEAAGGWLRWLTDSAGGQPRIGDDDEGRVFLSQTDPEPYVASVLAALAGLRRRPDLAPPGVEPHLRHLLLAPAPEPGAAPLGFRHFPTGGCSVFRWRAGETDNLCVFDHGPLGHLSIAAHGHADALALWLHVGGQPVLVDAGTFAYNASGPWRAHFRGTPAHNTLSVADADSSLASGPFTWSAKAAVTVLDSTAVEAEHDGFVARYGVRHRRRVERRENRIEITDRLIGGTRSLPVDIGFLIHPDLTVQSDGSGWVIRQGERALARIDGGTPLAGGLEIGTLDPPRGWYSPGFGSRRPAPRLTFRGALGADTACRLVITVLPGEAG